MHPTSLAKRQLDAQNRSIAAAEAIGHRHGLTLPDVRQVRQPDIAQMLKWEALADFLEALVNTQPGVTLADVLAIEGLSKTSARAIRRHFGEPEEDPTDEE